MRSSLIRTVETALSARLDIATYCRLVNLRNAVRGKVHRIAPVPGEDAAVHRADDGKDHIFICRRDRHNRYKRGVAEGVDRLARAYSLDLIADLIADLRDGLFIDCGANVGELGLWARARGFRYVAFEPEPLEARCVDLNNFDGHPTCIRKALWNEETILSFYNRADSAESSVFADADETPSMTLPATTLDIAVDLTGVTGPVIFKLEAEGAEPEVLQGAVKSLARIDWLAVDCGFERGPERAHTFVETNTFLQDHGFRLQAAKFTRVTALYRREK